MVVPYHGRELIVIDYKVMNLICAVLKKLVYTKLGQHVSVGNWWWCTCGQVQWPDQAWPSLAKPGLKHPRPWDA